MDSWLVEAYKQKIDNLHKEKANVSSIRNSMFMNFGDSSRDNKNMVKNNTEEDDVDSGAMIIVTDEDLN